jgi:outer membrane protein assembly factor BamB
VLPFTRTTTSCVLTLCILALGGPAFAASDFLSLGIWWSARLDSPLLASPSVDADRVYLPLRSGKIRALAIADGREVWAAEVPLTGALGVGEGLVFAVTERELFALDAATGRARWILPLSGIAVPPVSRAGWVMVGSGEDLLALRAADGQLVWRLTLDATLTAAVTIDGDHVYAPLADGTLAALDITRGSVTWRARLPARPGAVTALGDRLYLGCADKFFYALDVDDGGRAWRWRTAAAVLAPAAVDDGRVYYAALDNVVRAVDAASGVQKWRYAMEIRPFAGPAIDEDLLIVAGGGELRAVRLADGTLAGTWRAPAELASAPVFVPVSASGSARVVIVTGAATGDWRIYGLARSPEPAPQPLKEIPGRPLSPDAPPVPPAAPPRAAPHLP